MLTFAQLHDPQRRVRNRKVLVDTADTAGVFWHNGILIGPVLSAPAARA